jgi:thioesterase domain-containing protein
MGWEKVVDELEIRPVPGNHYTIVREPHVRVLAGELLTYCRRLDERSLTSSTAGSH